MSAKDIIKTKKSKATAEGSHEWLTERVMALFSIPLALWVVLTMVKFQGCGCYLDIKDFLGRPVNAAFASMLLVFIFSYLYLSLKVVFEDYISCNCAKWALILATKFVSIFAATMGVLSILNIVLK